MYVLDMFSDDDREFLGQIKNKTIQTEDKEAKAYDLSTLEKKFGTAVAYDAAFLKPAAMTRTDKEGKVHNLIRGKNGTYADKKEKETIEDKFKEILSYIDPDNSEVTATISTDGDTNVLRITHNGKTTEKTTPNLLKAVEYLEDMGLVKNESEVNEALFPGSELGNKLRNADAFMHDTELNKALGVGVGAGLTGSTAGVSLASSGGGIALFAPALGAGLLTGAMAVLGGVITYKTLKWLASKVFGTTEEALSFAKAHLAAAKQGAQQFEWNGKPYQVKVKDQKQIANLEIQINDLSSRVMNEGEFRDFPGSAKVAVPDDVVKGNINSIDNKIAKLKADMAKLIDRAHSGDQSARNQLAQIDAQRKLKEFAPDEGGGDEKQYLLQLADQMANAMYGPNKNAQATKDIKSKIVAAGGDVKISYNNDTTFNVVMYHPTYFKQGHLIKLVGNGDQVDESTKSVHRISLTVTDPNHPMVSKRKETIQKTVKVTSDNRDKAIKSAIAHYRKKGYKVHDHHYIGTAEPDVAEAGMPSSVVKSKQRYAAMSDKDFHTAHKDKSEDDLKAMAWRHGYGKGSTHYVDKHKKGQQGMAEGSVTPDVNVNKVHDDGHEKEWHIYRGKEMIGYVIKNQPDTAEGLYIAYGHGPGRAFVKEFTGLKSAVNYIASLKEGVAEGSDRVDSLVTDALKIMRGPEMSDAVLALKRVLGDRAYNERRGFYSFYIKQMLDMYGQQGVAEGNLNELDMFAPRTVYFKMADGNYIKADYRGSEGLTGHKANDNVTFTAMSWVPVNTARSLGLDKFLAKGSDPSTTASQNAQNIVGTSSPGEGPLGNRTIDVVDFVNSKEDTVPSALKTKVMQWVQKNTPQQQQGVAEGDYADGSSIKTPGSEDWKQQYQQAVMAVKNARTQQEYEAASDRAGRIKDLLASKGIQVGAVLGQQGVAEAFANPGSGSTGTSRGAKRIANTVRKALAKNSETPDQIAARKDFEAQTDARMRQKKKEQGVAEGSLEEDKGMTEGFNFNDKKGRWEWDDGTSYDVSQLTPAQKKRVAKWKAANPGKSQGRASPDTRGEHTPHGSGAGPRVMEQGVAEGISNRSVISAIVKAITEKRPDLLKYGSDRVSDAINSVAGMVGNNAQGIESGNLNSWINQVERILAQQIDEGKLTANDSPDTWIKRFQSSNHPKLSGKDPETLKKMALAARGRMLNKTPSLPKSKPVNGNYWWQDKNESAEPAKMSMRDYIKEADRLHDLMQQYDKIGDETNYQKAKAAYLELENSVRNGMIPEGEEIKSGRPRVRKVSIMRPDGSKGERFEVLNHAGVRVGPLFDDAKWAKEYLQRHYLKLLNLDEEATANPNDTVTMDVPMLIRIMEFSREDAKTDMDLHDVAEKLIDLSSNGNTLTMKDYDQVVPATNEPAAQEQPHEEPQLETKNVVGGRYWDSAEKRWKDQ